MDEKELREKVEEIYNGTIKIIKEKLEDKNIPSNLKLDIISTLIGKGQYSIKEEIKAYSEYLTDHQLT